MRKNNKPVKSMPMQTDRYVPPPGHLLQPYLQSIWRGQDSGKIRRETLLPDGSFTIIFCLDNPHSLYHSGMSAPLSFNTGFVSGVKTRMYQTLPAEYFSLIGISLKMETCAAFLPLPANELADLPVDTKWIFKNTDIIHEKLSETTDFKKQCSLLLNWLTNLLKPPAKQKLIHHVCTGLRERPSESQVWEISRSLGISERHLRRIFLQQVGISPAHYLRLSRFIKSIYLIPNSSSLTKIAHAAHYTDQAHFCRDFKEIAGMTPKEYRDAVGVVPGHIFSR